MAIQFFAELSAQGTATDAPRQPAEDGAGDGTDAGTRLTDKGAEIGSDLTAGKCGARASRRTAYGAKEGANHHGCSERSDFSRATARALT